MLVLDHIDRDLHQISHHGFHIAAHVAHFGEFACLNLGERGLSESRQTAGDFGFAHACCPDHEDVFGQNFIFEIAFDELPSSPVSQSHCDGSFGGLLAHDKTIQLGDDFPWSEIGK